MRTSFFGTDSKHPDEERTFAIDWSTHIGEATIDASAWDTDTGIEAETDAFTDTRTTVRLSGGTSRTKYYVRNTITLSDGDVLVGEFAIQVEDEKVS